uniref:Uncharacterized protein n=1 Tax=Proboscia inermis TaxID=420281 RepID=A0A7S0BXJ6_9STRA
MNFAPAMYCHLFVLFITLVSSTDAFVNYQCKLCNVKSNKAHVRLHAKKPFAGPIAKAKRQMDPDDYERVVKEKMKQNRKLSRDEAETDYNDFLENPYYALDKQEEYYKKLGYKDMYEGMIGEAEKEGNGDEVRERIETFQRNNKIKAASVLVVVASVFLYLRGLYDVDPTFLKGGLPNFNAR